MLVTIEKSEQSDFNKTVASLSTRCFKLIASCAGCFKIT